MEERVEVLENDLTHKWLCGGRIVAYIPATTTKATVDTWAATIEHDMANWPADQPYLALHDFSQIGLTPYNRQRGEEVLRQVPDHIKGRHAFVISRGILGVGLKFFGMNRFKRLCPGLEPAFFFNVADAIAWLQEGLSELCD